MKGARKALGNKLMTDLQQRLEQRLEPDLVLLHSSHPPSHSPRLHWAGGHAQQTLLCWRGLGRQSLPPILAGSPAPQAVNFASISALHESLHQKVSDCELVLRLATLRFAPESSTRAGQGSLAILASIDWHEVPIAGLCACWHRQERLTSLFHGFCAAASPSQD